MEADFYRFYKIDLLKLAFKEKKLTWRRFLIFIRGLPEDSAFNRFLRDKSRRSYIESDMDSIEREIKRIK